jgi:hypothetical protein
MARTIFVKNQDVAYHEAGHVVASKLFDEILKIAFATIDKVLSQEKDPKSLGGMSAKLKKTIADLTIYDKDKIILIMLAGICVDNIYQTEGAIKAKYYKNDTIHDLFENPAYEGDRDNALTWLYSLKGQIKPITSEYLRTTFEQLHNMFRDRLVWKTTVSIAEEMRAKKILYEHDINNIIANSKLLKFIKKKKNKILRQRGKLLGTIQEEKKAW